MYLPGNVGTVKTLLKLRKMATTAIKITAPNGVVNRLKFMTVSQGIHCDVDVFTCNDDFIPIGTPASGVSAFDEPEYHIKLRKEADAKGQYVREESTNSEWDPEKQPKESDFPEEQHK